MPAARNRPARREARTSRCRKRRRSAREDRIGLTFATPAWRPSPRFGSQFGHGAVPLHASKTAWLLESAVAMADALTATPWQGVVSLTVWLVIPA